MMGVPHDMQQLYTAQCTYFTSYATHYQSLPLKGHIVSRDLSSTYIIGAQLPVQVQLTALDKGQRIYFLDIMSMGVQRQVEVVGHYCGSETIVVRHTTLAVR